MPPPIKRKMRAPFVMDFDSSEDEEPRGVPAENKCIRVNAAESDEEVSSSPHRYTGRQYYNKKDEGREDGEYSRLDIYKNTGYCDNESSLCRTHKDLKQKGTLSIEEDEEPTQSVTGGNVYYRYEVDEENDISSEEEEEEEKTDKKYSRIGTYRNPLYYNDREFQIGTNEHESMKKEEEEIISSEEDEECFRPGRGGKSYHHYEEGMSCEEEEEEETNYSSGRNTLKREVVNSEDDEECHFGRNEVHDDDEEEEDILILSSDEDEKKVQSEEDNICASPERSVIHDNNPKPVSVSISEDEVVKKFKNREEKEGSRSSVYETEDYETLIQSSTDDDEEEKEGLKSINDCSRSSDNVPDTKPIRISTDKEDEKGCFENTVDKISSTVDWNNKQEPDSKAEYDEGKENKIKNEENDESSSLCKNQDVHYDNNEIKNKKAKVAPLDSDEWDSSDSEVDISSFGRYKFRKIDHEARFKRHQAIVREKERSLNALVNEWTNTRDNFKRIYCKTFGEWPEAKDSKK